MIHPTATVRVGRRRPIIVCVATGAREADRFHEAATHTTACRSGRYATLFGIMLLLLLLLVVLVVELLLLLLL